MDESDLTREQLLLACEVLTHLVSEEYGMSLGEVILTYSSGSPEQAAAAVAVEQVFTEDAWEAARPARDAARKAARRGSD